MNQSRILGAGQKAHNNLNKLGIGLFCLYVFMSYMAQDVIFPSSVGSFTLFLFLGYSALFVFANGKVLIEKITIWQAVFIAISLVSMLYSTEKQIIGGFFYFLIINIVIVFLLCQYKFNITSIKVVCWTYVFSAASMVISLMATGNMNDSTGRLGNELVGNANHFALKLMTSTMYALWLMLYGKHGKIKNIILALAVGFNYYAMFLSGGRKFVVIPVIFLYILLLFKQDKKGRRHAITYTVVILLIVVLLYNLIMKVPMFYDIIGVRMESFFNLFSGDIENVDNSAQIRDQMRKMALSKWLQCPIWGYGHDSFKDYNVTVTGHRMYSHDNYAELLYNLGIIGLIAYYWFYGKTLLTAFKGKNTIPLYARAFAVATIVSLVVYGYGAVNYTDTIGCIMLFITFKLLQVKCEGEKQNGGELNV